MTRNLDAYTFSTKKGFNSVLIKLRYKEFRRFFRGDSCLEFGCADGEGTKLLLKHFKRIVCVDGSKKLIERASKEIKIKKVTFIHSFFENVEINRKFDVILLTHVLEHVDDPLAVLRSAKRFLKKESIMIVDVPNALSIHRQVGVLMGMIQTEYSLHHGDLSIGHQRIYDTNLLKNDIMKAGLRVVHEGGLFIKPFSNAQMEKLLTKKGIDAFNEVGKRYPAIAGEIYVVCSL